MKEKLINKILKRTDIFAKEKLEELDEVVLERLCLIDNTYALEDIILVLLDLKSDVSLSIAYINAYDLNLLGIGKYDDYINQLLLSNIDLALKAEALNKMMLAKNEFQLKYIYYIYENKDIEYKELIVDIILKCNKEFQVVGVYNIFSNIETKKECIAEYIELAKIIAKENDEYKVKIYTDINWNLDILDLGLLLPVAKLISKCKCKNQAKNMDNYLDNIDSKNSPYILKYSEYFLKTTDENKLKCLEAYLTYCFNHSLLVEEEKVNLIINSRHKFNTDAITNTLTIGRLIEKNLDEEAARILNDSRKDYNALYAEYSINIASANSLSGAMIINESETKYKAKKVYDTIYAFANTDEIDISLEYAALINSVHTKAEIDLIYLLSQNLYLINLGIALPIARVIANATDCEEDIVKISECLEDEENKIKAIKGYATLIQNVDLNNRQKAENIINRVLLKTQNKPIHFEPAEEKEPFLKVPKLIKVKNLKNK